ncbi:MAG: type II toxin-antitoxin system RelE/ParE family toxin [Phycisphaeraceae bacterium]
MNVRFLRGVHDELIEAMDWYSAQKPGLGDRFVREFWSTVSQIGDTPTAYSKVSRTARKCNLKHFEYGIIYRVREQTIVVAAVMHLKRRPGYWKHRR